MMEAYPLRFTPQAWRDWHGLKMEGKLEVRELLNGLMVGREQGSSHPYFSDEQGRPSRYVVGNTYAVIYRMGTPDTLDRMTEVIIMAIGTKDSLLIPDPNEDF